MKLYEKEINNGNISFHSDSTVRVDYKGLCVSEEATKENIMEVLLNILIPRSIDLDGSALSEICDNITSIIDEGLINSYPNMEVEKGSLHYIGGNIVFKRKEDIYNSKKICKVIRAVDGNLNDTTIKLYLLKNEISINENDFKDFLKDIREYDSDDKPVINITKENMKDYIDRVPIEVMCTFLNEYFSGRR